MRRLLACALLAFVLAGCGGSSAGGGGSEGTASLWVTRDEGAETILTATVPAGETVLRALDREADIETRYGGRFVQSIGGLQGSLSAQRDWFYFLNGIEPDLGAAEVKLRPGDVVWWDLRSWEGAAQAQPVVVGAFPEPFLHGWNGRPRPAEVEAPPELAAEQRALARLLPATGEGEPNRFVLEVKEGEDGATLTATRGPGNADPVTFTLAGSLEAVRAAAQALADDPSIVRYRYTARFGPDGSVVG